MKACKKYLSIVAILLLLPGIALSANCEVSLSSEEIFTAVDYDPTNSGETQKQLNLNVQTSGENCETAVLRFGENEGSTTRQPAFSIYAGDLELFTSKNAVGFQNDLKLEFQEKNINTAIQLVIPAGQMAAPGNIAQRIGIDLIELNGKSETVTLGRISTAISVVSSLSGGFAGTEVSELAQSVDLNLGELTQGKASRRVMLNIRSNNRYQMTIRSSHAGQLKLDANSELIAPSFLKYIFKLDNQEIDFSGNDSQHAELPVTPANGTSHSMELIISGNPDEVRAGEYKDIITIDIQQNL